MLQAELSGDQVAVQVLEAAEAQTADELNEELEKLAEKQIEEQAAMEVKQVEEMINMEHELQVEEEAAGQQVADQIEEQKLKVGNTSIKSSPSALKLFQSLSHPIAFCPLHLLLKSCSKYRRNDIPCFKKKNVACGVVSPLHSVHC